MRSSTFLFKNASQATNTVLGAQSYSTCSQSMLPAQPSTLTSTCEAKLASVALQLMLSSPLAGTELLVSLPQRERRFLAQAKAAPCPCSSSDCRPPPGLLPFNHRVSQERREKWPLASFKRGRDVSF